MTALGPGHAGPYTLRTARRPFRKRNDMTVLDLFADGDLGLWAVDAVPRDVVGTVFTTDSVVADHARSRGYAPTMDDPHEWSDLEP